MSASVSRNGHKRNVVSRKSTHFLPIFFSLYLQELQKSRRHFVFLTLRLAIFKSKRLRDRACTRQQHTAAGSGTANQIREPTLLLDQHWQQITQHNRATSRALWTCRSVPCAVRVSATKDTSRSVWVHSLILTVCAQKLDYESIKEEGELSSITTSRRRCTDAEETSFQAKPDRHAD